MREHYVIHKGERESNLSIVEISFETPWSMNTDNDMNTRHDNAIILEKLEDRVLQLIKCIFRYIYLLIGIFLFILFLDFINFLVFNTHRKWE